MVIVLFKTNHFTHCFLKQTIYVPTSCRALLPSKWIRTRKTKTRRAGLAMWAQRALSEDYKQLRARPENIMKWVLSYLVWV